MVRPVWEPPHPLFFKDLTSPFICRRRDDLPCMATTSLDNLCDKSARRDSGDRSTRIKGASGERGGAAYAFQMLTLCSGSR